MMTKCKFCGEDIFYKEKGHGEGLCGNKKELKTDGGNKSK